jgi:uncharacterized protein (TIGR02145 family)
LVEYVLVIEIITVVSVKCKQILKKKIEKFRKKMKKVLFLMFMLFLIVSGTANLKAQVRIGGTAGPHGSAVLDLNVDDSIPDQPANFGGLLLPRIYLEDVKQALNAVTPLDGAIVWNTNENFYLGKGVYVWGDTVWVPIQRTLFVNSTQQPVTANPMVAILSNPALGVGMTFQVPASYQDMSNTAQFIWEITAEEVPNEESYTLKPVISGSRHEIAFVPYDAVNRKYTARVKAIPNNGASDVEWWSTEVTSAAGKYQGWYRLTGPTGYDIFATNYSNPVNGRNRTQMSLTGNSYSVETVVGIDGTPNYSWKIITDQTGCASLSDDGNSYTVGLNFGGDILGKEGLVGNSTVADTIVLQCTVNDGRKDYVLQRRITVGDRDECSPAAGLLDAEGNQYTVSKFGGVCWMTQNLRSTWTKQGSQIQEIPRDNNEINDYNAVVYYYPGAYTAENLPPAEYGFLYSWGAANIGTVPTEATNAFNGKTSDRQGICPDGWTLPSDYDWNQLEKEIAEHPGLYSSESTTISPDPWDPAHEITLGWRPTTGNPSAEWWGRRMKSPTAVNSTTSNGKSNTDGTGFNALLVGYLDSANPVGFGTYTYIWSSSAGSSTLAWRRNLRNGYSGAYRNTDHKSFLFTVRCKK